MCSADDPGFSLPDVREDWQTLLLDDLQLMLEPEDQEDLAALIRENPRRRFVLLTNREIRLPSFSVTSTLPSLMNGGKDFSPWSKKDDLLYATLRVPVELALGRDGVCLADCAIAESKFEKGEAKTVARQLHLI